jgi:hypothetical protein
MSIKEPIYFGKQKLVFNCAKNKYEDFVETTKPNDTSLNNESVNSICSDSTNESESFLGENQKPNLKNYFEYDSNFFNLSYDMQKVVFSLYNVAMSKHGDKDAKLYKYYVYPFKLNDTHNKINIIS